MPSFTPAKRSSPFCSYFSGLLLCTAALLWALLAIGLSTAHFAGAQRQLALTDAATAEVFAENTMAYLRGEEESWNAAALLAGQGLAPTAAFESHMAGVRRAVRIGRTAGCLLPGVGLLLLLPVILKKRRFSHKAWVLGSLTPLLLCAGLALWAALDFEGFWWQLHVHLIPDGIFSQNEPIMALFPLELFAGYAAPVAAAFGLCAALLAVLPKFSAFLKKEVYHEYSH